MSQEVEDLLAREGMDDVDDLMRWARDRAANLVPSLQGDDELGRGRSDGDDGESHDHVLHAQDLCDPRGSADQKFSTDRQHDETEQDPQPRGHREDRRRR